MKMSSSYGSNCEGIARIQLQLTQLYADVGNKMISDQMLRDAQKTLQDPLCPKTKVTDQMMRSVEYYQSHPGMLHMQSMPAIYRYLSLIVLLVGIGVHVFDSFVNLFGKEVESVKAYNFPKCSVVEDTMHSTFDFRNGVIATSLSSRLISSDSNDLVIFGNEGSITVTNFYSTTVSSKLFVNNKLLGEFDGKVDMYAEEVKDFVGRCEKIAGPEDALLSTKMHLYSQESACTGKSIPV